MIYSIRNAEITAEFSDLGAEPQSIRENGGREAVWQGLAEHWSGRSPILFPVIGVFPKSEYICEGKSYKLGCHGFVKSTVFECEQISDTEILFWTESTKETLEVYPFDFRLEVRYSLEGRSLITQFNVINKCDRQMYFAVGSHTGYTLADGQENYRIRFEKAEKKESYSVIGNDEEINRNKLMDSDILPITASLFTLGAQTFSSLVSNYLVLEKNDGTPLVKIHFGNFPYVTLWSKPNAPFVCIEPWSCESAHYTTTNILENQKDITALKPFGSKIYSYTITV